MASPAFIIKKGDLLPILSATLRDQDGAAADLTGFSLMELRYRLKGGGATTTRTATIVLAASGTVSYTWVVADTATAGVYEAEWVGTAAGGEPQTWPTDGYFEYEIEEDLL